ncbi:MAG: hypothetical protein WKF30_16050 [Pyrinomonadaceae bacterium]
MRTQKQLDGATHVVETKQTRSNLGAQTGASFGVREDDSEDIRIDSGVVETATNGGETTTLRGGGYVQVNHSGNVVKRERLLEPPLPVVPKDMETFLTGSEGTAGVVLRWQHDAHAAAAATCMWRSRPRRFSWRRARFTNAANWRAASRPSAK